MEFDQQRHVEQIQLTDVRHLGLNAKQLLFGDSYTLFSAAPSVHDIINY